MLFTAGTMLAGASVIDTTNTQEAHVEGMQGTETTTVQETGTEDQENETGNQTTAQPERQAAVTFENQTSNGSTLVVEEATLAEDGFVAVHGTFGHVIGHSGYLEAGTYENLTIEVGGSIPAAAYRGNVTALEGVTQNVTTGNESVTVNLTSTFVAVIHSDTDNNQEFDYVATQGANDSAYQTEENRMVWDSAEVLFDGIELTFDSITVEAADLEETTTAEEAETAEETTVEGTAEETTTAEEAETTTGEETETETTVEETTAVAGTETNVTFSNQTSNGSTVTVDSVRFPEGGFVSIVVLNQTAEVQGVVGEPEDRTTAGVSEYLDPGAHSNVTVQLNESIELGPEDRQNLVAVLHHDSNDNQEYDFVSSEGSADTPYTLQGEPITDDAVVTFTTAEDGETPATTETEAETETTTETETEAETETTTETETVAENATTETTAQANESEVAETFVFGGEVAAWTARAPSDIEGQTNPTLELQAGETYNFTWVNVDGLPHNVVITNGDGDIVVRTEVITGEGGRQSVVFTAPETGGTYYCEVHPGSMRGEIVIVSGE